MKPGDIVYRTANENGKYVFEPVEVLSVGIGKAPDKDGKMVKARSAEIRTQSGEKDVVLAGLLTTIPYVPEIEQQIIDKESKGS
jgi:hypothetical protein